MRLGCLHFLTPTKKCSLFQPNYNTHRHGNSGLSSHRSQMTTKCLSGHRTNQYSIFYRGWDCTRKTCPRVRIALTNYCTTLISSYTPKKENPLEVRGQRVFHRHRVQGRTDLVVLPTRRHGGPIIRNMVEVAIEIKTVAGLQHSEDGCLLEAQLQLIGLNAFNTLKSPPVVLSNLAKTHHVVYLDYNQDGWSYVIKRKKCSTFAAAIHFARKVAEERSISSNFSRPMTDELQ